MLSLLHADNEFDFFNQVNILLAEEGENTEIIEVGYTRGKYFGVINRDPDFLSSEDIKEFLRNNNVEVKYGKLQRASDSYRM